MSVELRKFDKSSFELKELKGLYKSAFPLSERTPFRMLIRKISLPFVDCFSIYYDGRWAGFTYVVSNQNVSYVFYLAVSPDFRGCGIGSSVLSLLKERYRDNILLLAIEEVDEKYPNYSERINRQRFYERNGFHLNGYKIREATEIYDAMSTSPNINPQVYNEMFTKYYSRLMGMIIKTKMYK